jgi:hypothetical protein
MTFFSPDSLYWVQGLLVSLMAGLVLALFVGVLLLVRPQALFALNALLSRWVDTDEVLGKLDQPHHIERFLYRHHRILGAMIVAGAGFVLWRWAFAYERSEFLAAMGTRFLADGLDWLPAALETALVALHGGILMVGFLVIFRPSLLKGFERTANRWQRGPATTRLDSVIVGVDGAVEDHPRVTGLLLVLAACWCLLALLPIVADLLKR